MTGLAALFGTYGGLIGLVVFGLFALVAYLCVMITKVSLRLVDLKKSAYESGLLPDRRGNKR